MKPVNGAFQKTVKEIAEIIEGNVIGDDSTVITGIRGIKEAEEGDLTFIANSRYVSLMKHTRAAAIITSREVDPVGKRVVIQTENPSLAFAKMVSLIAPNELYRPKGIHPTAIIGEKVSLGEGVAIGPYTVIGDHVSIGDHTIIYTNVYIGPHTAIGEDTIIESNVSIRERIEVGSRVMIHSGTVVGSDGFGFATVKGVHQRIPQIGTVVIEDDCEIGSNVTIDRARFGKTLIGRGTKVDNLVQIAHNVTIGENSIIVAQAGIAGSTTIGKCVTLAGQSGVVGHISIGDNSVVAGKAGVTKSVPKNSCVSGYPAKSHQQAKRINACIQRLPKIFKTITELEEKIRQLEERLNGTTSEDNQ